MNMSLDTNIKNIVEIGNNNPVFDDLVDAINDYIENTLNEDQDLIDQLFEYRLADMECASDLDYKTIARFFEIMRDYAITSMV